MADGNGLTERIYPKASAPLTWAVLEASNDRADRWMRACQATRRERDELAAALEDHRHCPPAGQSTAEVGLG